MNFSAPGFGLALRCTSSRRKSGFNGLDRKRLFFLSAEEFANGKEKSRTNTCACNSLQILKKALNDAEWNRKVNATCIGRATLWMRNSQRLQRTDIPFGKGSRGKNRERDSPGSSVEQVK